MLCEWGLELLLVDRSPAFYGGVILLNFLLTTVIPLVFVAHVYK